MIKSIYFLWTWIIVTINGCQYMKNVKHATIDCSTDEETGIKSCRYECKPGSDMIGSPEIQCDILGLQVSETPICHPDYTKCGKGNKSKKCPIITPSDIQDYQKVRRTYDSDQLDFLQMIEQEISKMQSSSSGRTRNKRMIRCHAQYCSIHCPAIQNARLARTCNFCRARRLSCGGGVFEV